MSEPEKPRIYSASERDLQDINKLNELKSSALFQPGEMVMRDDNLLIINAKPVPHSQYIRIEKVPYKFTGLFVERLIEPGVDQKVEKMLRQYDSVKAQFKLGDPFYMHVLTDTGQDGRRAIISTYQATGVEEDSSRSLHVYERCVFINGVGILLHCVAIKNPRSDIEQILLSLDQQLLKGQTTARRLLNLERIAQEEQESDAAGGIALKEFEEAYCEKPSGIYSSISLFNHKQIWEIINRFKKALLN